MATIEKTIEIPEAVLQASNITYDNTTSGLAATDAQAALDEVNNRIIHLTQAEYDALPDTKYTDNVVYMIEDATSISTEVQDAIDEAASEAIIYGDIYNGEVSTDSADSQLLEFTAYGKSEQASYTGKNLIDVMGMTYQYVSLVNYTLKDNTVTLTTTQDATNQTSFAQLRGTIDFEAYAGKEVTLSVGNWTTTMQDSAPVVYIAEYDSSDTLLGDIHQIWLVDGSTKTTFTLNESMKKIMLFFRVNQYQQNDGVTVPTGTIVTFSNVQLELGNTATDFEPYVGVTASPNPNYPQHIYSVADKSVNLLENTATTQTVEGITYTVNDDGSVTANGTTGGAASWIYVNNTLTLPAGSYILNGAPKGSSLSTYGLYFYIGSDLYFDYGYDSGVEFTLTEDTLIPVRIIVYTNQTVSNLTFYPMIRKKEVTDTTFVPYHNVNDLVVKTEGKNLLGGLEFANRIYNCNSDKVVIDETNKTVTFSYNPNYNIESMSTLYSDFKENTQYTIVLNGMQLTTVSNNEVYYPNIRIEYTDGSVDELQNWVSALNVNTNFIKVTNPDKSVKRLLYMYHTYAITSTLNYEQCGIFEGVITADEFVPYQSTKATLELTDALRGFKVDKKIDYLYDINYTDKTGQQWVCDTIEKFADGTGQITRRIRRDVFDGSDDETWNYQEQLPSGLYRYYTSLSGQHKKAGFKTSICSHFIHTDETTFSNVEEVSFATHPASTSRTIQFFVEFATIDEWKTWLKSNPITVDSILETPIVEPLTAEQLTELVKLYSIEGICTIDTDDIGDVKAKYLKNNEQARVLKAMIGTGQGAGVSSWNYLQDKPTNLIYGTEEDAVAVTPIDNLTQADIVDDLVTEDSTKALSATQGKVLNDTVTNILGDLATEYDSSKTYTVRDYCIHEGLMYKCITAVTTTEEFDTSKWEQTTCGDEFNVLNNKLTDLKPTTLWINPNIGSSFASQVLNLDLTSYADGELEIEFFRHAQETDFRRIERVKISAGARGMLSMIYGSTPAYRAFAISSDLSAISFQGGTKCSTSGNALDDTMCVPFRIFAIKNGN